MDFSHPSNPKFLAIVNATNKGCLGSGGIDGAISAAGGPSLLTERQALPIIGARHKVQKTGSAALTGPNSYGKLYALHIIHAVGPNHAQFKNWIKGDELLSLAYASSQAWHARRVHI